MAMVLLAILLRAVSAIPSAAAHGPLKAGALRVGNACAGGRRRIGHSGFGAGLRSVFRFLAGTKLGGFTFRDFAVGFVGFHGSGLKFGATFVLLRFFVSLVMSLVVRGGARLMEV